MNLRWRLLGGSALVFLLSVATAAPAGAEIVVLTSGSTLAVKSHRYDGDRIVLQLRRGGEVTCDKDLVEKILEDEIPFHEPKPEAVPSPSVDRPAAAASLLDFSAVPYSDLITTMAQAHGVDPLLVHSLIKVESNYEPRARSHKGAMGLMQLMPSTARQYKVRNPYDPKANIAAGIQHLKSLIDRLGATDLALAAYNAGEGAVKKFNGIPPYQETRNYVRRILALSGLR